MRNPLDIAELVETVELADASFARDAGERAGLAPRRVERRTLEGTLHTVSRPGIPDIVDEPMPTEPPGHGARVWVAGCSLHRTVPTAAPGR